MRDKAQPEKVYVAASRIPSAGKGLFAKQPIRKGEDICFYSGRLIDSTDCKFEDPSYVVEFELGRGFKLVGDFADQAPGIYANSVHPENDDVTQNARFVLSSKQVLQAGRGRFPLRAIKDIACKEEIIVNYGKNYWKTLENWRAFGPPVKSAAAIARAERAVRRSLIANGNSGSDGANQRGDCGQRS